jgi:hypothetical protein
MEGFPESCRWRDQKVEVVAGPEKKREEKADSLLSSVFYILPLLSPIFKGLSAIQGSNPSLFIHRSSDIDELASIHFTGPPVNGNSSSFYFPAFDQIISPHSLPGPLPETSLHVYIPTVTAT